VGSSSVNEVLHPTFFIFAEGLKKTILCGGRLHILHHILDLYD